MSRSLVRLYVAQGGQSASTVATIEVVQQITDAIRAGRAFGLSSETVSPSRRTERSSMMILAPSAGGLVISVTPGTPIPLGRDGRPVRLTPQGQPAEPVVAYDTVEAQPEVVFELLWAPLSEPAKGTVE